MITDANAVEAMGSRFSRRLSPSRHSTTRGLCVGRDVSAGPPTGYIAVLMDNLPKKRFPKSPLLRNNSCMRAELNATQSPLTMSKFAQHERAGSLRGIADCCFLWRLVSTGQKETPVQAGAAFLWRCRAGIDQRPRNFAGMPSKLLFPIIWKMTLISIPPMWMAPTSAKPLQSFSNAAGG